VTLLAKASSNLPEAEMGESLLLEAVIMQQLYKDLANLESAVVT
jgi:hypothetical protein